MNSPAVALILSALTERQCRPKPNPRGHESRCPAHEDRMPSLGVLQGDNGCAILKCAAGCADTEIISTLGLDTRMHRGNKGGWFINTDTPAPPLTPNGRGGGKPKKTHTTLADAISAAQYGQSQRLELPKESLALAGQWPYHNAAGKVVAVAARFNLPADPGQKGGKPPKQFSPIHAVPGGWQVGDPKAWPLYRLVDVTQAVTTTGRLWWHEGEKAADAWANVIGPSTTTAHGAKSPGMSDYTPLVGVDEVIILPDNDPPAIKNGKPQLHPDGAPVIPGMDYAHDIARRVMAVAPLAKVRIILLPHLPPKGDAVEYLESWSNAPVDAILAELDTLIAATPPLTAPPPRHDAQTGADAPSSNAGTASVEPTATSAPTITEPPVPDQPHNTPTEAAKAGKPWDLRDYGNAHRFVHMHRDKCRWDCRRCMWRVWDGRHWAADENETKIYPLAEKTVRAMFDEAKKCPTAAVAEAIAKWASKSLSRTQLENMLYLATKQPEMTPPADAWDQHPYLFCCKNGVIDLKTATLEPHKPAQLITSLSPATFDLNAYADDFLLKCLLDWHDNPDVITFLQRAAGYSLTGDISEEKLFLLHGPPAAGKSSFIGMMKSVLGTYSRTADFESFLKRSHSNGGGPRGDIARLAGARFVSAAESEEGKEIAEGLIKTMTGGDTVVARHLHRAEVEFRPQFKLWLMTNHAPQMDADDQAMWRRVVRVPFDKARDPSQRDRNVKRRLEDVDQTGTAFLAWAVMGCHQWLQSGLSVPQALDKATDSLREEMDTTLEFFEERMEFNALSSCTFMDVAQAYDNWCQERRIAANRRIGNKRLALKLKARGALNKSSNSKRYWEGCRPK